MEDPASAGAKKKPRYSIEYQGFRLVGMTGFEPATTRPPDVYSNRAELHPEVHSRENLSFGTANIEFFFYSAKPFGFFLQKKYKLIT
mgnify:CR=1 FL=1